MEQGDDPTKDFERNKNFYINGIKPRSSQIIEVPIAIEDPYGQNGFYKDYKGHLETNIKYREFFASGNEFRN